MEQNGYPESQRVRGKERREGTLLNECEQPCLLPFHRSQDVNQQGIRKTDVPLIHELAARWALRQRLLIFGLMKPWCGQAP